MLNEVKTVRYDFLRRLVLHTTTPNDGWVQQKVGTPPDIATYNGALKIELNSTNQAQTNRACFGVDLPYRAQDIKELRFLVAAESLGALVYAAVGIAGVDPYGDNWWGCGFLVDPDNDVFAVSRDGSAATLIDVPTGQSLGTTFKELVLDLHSGVMPRDPREGGPVGGRAVIQPSMTDARGRLARVARSELMSLGGVSGHCGLFAQLMKASGAGTGVLYVKEIEVVLKNLQHAQVTTTTTSTTTAAPTTTSTSTSSGGT